MSLAAPDIEIVCDGIEFPEGPIALDDGSVILVEIAGGNLSRISPAGKKSLIAHLGGGPNGAAVGPDGAVYVCNNGGFGWVRERGHMRSNGMQSEDYVTGRIERVNPATGKFECLYDTCDGRKIRGPNDIVFDRHGGFYFTDHGKVRARDLDRGAVYYAKADGSLIREVIFPISLPDGVCLSPEEDFLYVTETETARLWKFPIRAPGELELQPFPSLHGGIIVHGAGGFQRFDSMKAEADGHVCIGTLQNGGVTVVSPRDGSAEHVPMPDVYTTNVCFGGPDMRTLYVTLSTTGRLARVKWPRPGLRLNYLDRIG